MTSLEEFMTSRDWRWSQGGYWVHDNLGALAPDQARYLYLSSLEAERQSLETMQINCSGGGDWRRYIVHRLAELDRQIAAVKGEA